MFKNRFYDLNSQYFTPIGISGNALVGKDTLCNELITNFQIKFKIKAKRCSIAGDFIRKDLKDLLFKKLNKKIDPTDASQKAFLRPLMVEYGRYMRNQTKGRYFIEKLNKNNEFGLNFVPIIPDIRYVEYENDELFWLKEEKKGILIYLERKGIEPANEFEKKNNKILKKNADLVISIPTFKNLNDYSRFMENKIDKILTIYQQGNVLLSCKS
jgi:hypothetical protein